MDLIIIIPQFCDPIMGPQVAGVGSLATFLWPAFSIGSFLKSVVLYAVGGMIILEMINRYRQSAADAANAQKAQQWQHEYHEAVLAHEAAERKRQQERQMYNHLLRAQQEADELRKRARAEVERRRDAERRRREDADLNRRREEARRRQRNWDERERRADNDRRRRQREDRARRRRTEQEARANLVLRLTNLFRHLDYDVNDLLTAADFRGFAALCTSDVTERRVMDLWTRIRNVCDRNGDGSVTLEEFRNGIVSNEAFVGDIDEIDAVLDAVRREYEARQQHAPQPPLAPPGSPGWFDQRQHHGLFGPAFANPFSGWLRAVGGPGAHHPPHQNGPANFGPVHHPQHPQHHPQQGINALFQEPGGLPELPPQNTIQRLWGSVRNSWLFSRF